MMATRHKKPANRYLTVDKTDNFRVVYKVFWRRFRTWKGNTSQKKARGRLVNIVLRKHLVKVGTSVSHVSVSFQNGWSFPKKLVNWNYAYKRVKAKTISYHIIPSWMNGSAVNKMSNEKQFESCHDGNMIRRKIAPPPPWNQQEI